MTFHFKVNERPLGIHLILFPQQPNTQSKIDKAFASRSHVLIHFMDNYSASPQPLKNVFRQLQIVMHMSCTNEGLVKLHLQHPLQFDSLCNFHTS